MGMAAAIAWAAEAAAIITAGAEAADIITAGAIAAIDTLTSPGAAFVDPLPQRK